MLPSSVWEKLNPVVDLNDPNVWAQCLHEWTKISKQTIPIVVKILFIVQHRYTLRYACIRSSAYQPQLCRFSKGNYVYLQCEAPMTLDIKAWCTIFHVKDVVPSDILLLEGKDGQKCQNHYKNCGDCHLPIERTLHPKIVVVPNGLLCFVYCEKKRGNHVVVWHMSMRLAYDILNFVFDFVTFRRLNLSSMLEILRTCYILGNVLIVSKRQTHYCHDDNIVFLVD